MTDNWLFNFNKNSRKSENLNFYLVTFADTHEQFRLIEIFNCLSKYDQVIYSDIKQPFCILKISENTIKLIKRAVFVKNISLLLYVENLSLKYKNIEQNITNDIEKTTESHLSIFKHDNLIKNVINFSKYFNPKSCAGKIVTHKCYYLQRDDFFKALDPIISQKVDLKTPDLIYKLSVFLNDKSDLERTFFFSLDIGLFTIRKHILNLKIPDRLFIGRTTMDPEIAMWMYNMLSKNTNDFTEIKEQNSVSNDKWPINQLSQFIRQNFSISDIENVVIDPFCGSAGLLLLPSILNDFVIGSDINRHEMIGKNKYEICENKTLDENLKAQVDNFINLRSKSDKIHSYEEHCMLKFGSKEKTTNQKNKTLDQKEKTLDQKEKTLDHKEKTLDRKEKLELKVPEPLFFIQDLPGTRTCLQNTNVLSNFYQYNTSDKVISFFNLDIADLKQFFQNYEIIHQKNHLPIEKILNGLKNDIVN
ncbi:putative RNA methylase, partial [Pseudoloma neurophilia]